MRKRKLIYNTAVNGIREQQPHWKDCLISTSRWLPTIVSALYVRNHFNKETKAAALELVNSIKEEFVTTLKTLPWLDDKTKTAALHKIEKMIAYIGYPDELLDDEKLVEYYDELNFDELKNFAFRKLRKPVTKTDWITHSITTSVNAFYSTFENSISKLHKKSSNSLRKCFCKFPEIPAAILQGPFFSVDRPNYMNFGALGMLIGHEITRNFFILFTKHFLIFCIFSRRVRRPWTAVWLGRKSGWLVGQRHKQGFLKEVSLHSRAIWKFHRTECRFEIERNSHTRRKYCRQRWNQTRLFCL